MKANQEMCVADMLCKLDRLNEALCDICNRLNYHAGSRLSVAMDRIEQAIEVIEDCAEAGIVK